MRSVASSPVNRQSWALEDLDTLRRRLILYRRTADGRKSLINSMVAHDETIKAGKEQDVYLSSLIVDLYGKCGALHDAHVWFGLMQEADSFSWNCLISGYVGCRRSVEALQLFEQMLQECVIPSSATLATIVSACSSKEALNQGRQLDARSACSDLEAYDVVQTALISMYNKCGKHNEAQNVFDTMLERDTISWKAMLSASVEQGDSKSTIQLYSQMQMEGVPPDRYSYSMMFTACASDAAVKEGQQVHACVLSHGHEMNDVVMLTLINMYNKCGSVSNATAVFYTSHRQDVSLWNAVVKAYACSGVEIELGEVARFFNRMLLEALLPDKVIFLSALAECGSRAALWRGRQLHVWLTGAQTMLDIQLETALLTMYGKSGSFVDASIVFNKMHEHDIVSWNAIITALLQNDQKSLAIQLFEQVQQEGLMPNNITLTYALCGCTESSLLPLGKRIHARTVTVAGLKDDLVIGNAQIKMYCSCGNMSEAQMLFDAMVHRDNITWNSLMGGYAHNGDMGTTFKLFNLMCLQNIPPDQATYVSIFSVLADDIPGRLSEGMAIHAHIVLNGLDSDALIRKMLLKFYGSCGSLRDTECMFEKCNQQDVISWNLMSTAYILLDYYKEATQMFDRMPQAGVTLDNVTFLNLIDACANMSSLQYGREAHIKLNLYGLENDTLVATCLVKLYAKCGSLEEARWMFDHVPERDVVAWTSMIATNVQLGNNEEALQLFEKMCEGVLPDVVAFTSALNACENQSSLLEGSLIHTCITQYQMESHMNIVTSLVHMYGKCGSLSDANATFSNVSEPTISLWNAVISSYAQCGDGIKVFHFLHAMRQQGIVPDRVIFVSVLCGYSRAGLVDESYACMLSILPSLGLAPCLEHYECIVDLLGRAGQVDEAEGLIELMPVIPSAVSWASFFTTSKNHVNVKRAEAAMNHLIEVDPVDPATYVALSNSYAAAEGSDEAEIEDSKQVDYWEDSKQVDYREDGHLQNVWEEAG